MEIVGDARSLERSFAKASRATKGFGSDMRQANRHVSRSQRAFGSLRGSVLGLAGGFVGVAGLTSAVHAAFSEMADAQKVTAQTNAALKSTQGAANVTAKHVDELATSLLNLSGTDDEVIKSGENLLLTFTSIRNEVGKGNDVFDQATKTALDMSVALGEDMKSASIQLGKALQDPIKGITALRRVGVNFTDAQKKQIKALVASGHTLEAQKVILHELNREFGGSARAAGQTLPGKLNILRETALNLAGSIAQVLTPSITRAVDSIVKWLQNSKNQKTVLDTVKAAATVLGNAVRALVAVFRALNGITGSTANTLKLLLGVLIAIKALQMAAAISSMARSFGLLAGASGAANAQSLLLLTSLRALTGIGLITIGVELILRRNEVDSWLKRHHLGFATKSLLGNLGLPDPFGRGHSRPTVAPVGARGPVVVHGGIHLHGVQNVKQLENELGKRRKQRPHARRGGRS